jgi:hypothetical protein
MIAKLRAIPRSRITFFARRSRFGSGAAGPRSRTPRPGDHAVWVMPRSAAAAIVTRDAAARRDLDATTHAYPVSSRRGGRQPPALCPDHLGLEHVTCLQRLS